MSKKVFIGVGHGGADPGAVANGIKEKDANLDIALACAKALENNGVIVKVSRKTDVTEDLTVRIKEANAFKPDLALDIHNNAGGGDGAEVYHSRANSYDDALAKNILDEIVKIGQNSRGAKTKLTSDGSDYFGFIRQVTCPSVLVECAFLDSNDVKIIDTKAEREKMGIAIAKGVLKTLGLTYSEKSKTEVKTEMYRVRKSWVDAKTQIGAFRDLENAKELADKNKGYKVFNSAGVCVYTPGSKDESFMVQVKIDDLYIMSEAGGGNRMGFVPPGAYTIVETKRVGSYTWGKLKSGAGWIALEYTERL